MADRRTADAEAELASLKEAVEILKTKVKEIEDLLIERSESLAPKGYYLRLGRGDPYTREDSQLPLVWHRFPNYNDD